MKRPPPLLRRLLIAVLATIGVVITLFAALIAGLFIGKGTLNLGFMSIKLDLPPAEAPAR